MKACTLTLGFSGRVFQNHNYAQEVRRGKYEAGEISNQRIVGREFQLQ
jgi:hypothetical protein